MQLREIKLTAEGGQSAGDTKIGGAPDWIQEPVSVECCGEPMLFLGQIDTLAIPDVRFPDSALVYVFYCRKCADTFAVLQCC